MSFIDIQFPTKISYGSGGGPRYDTSIVVIKSGKEKRNINWDYPRIEFDVSYGVRDFDDLEDLIAFFHIVQGKGYTFRFKDHSDYKSCKTAAAPAFADQIIGTGDGNTTQFQLYKTYSYNASATRQSRKITKPVTGTVLIGIDGTEQTSGWGVDSITGIVTFSSAPANGVSITAGYEFDIEARFDSDTLSTDIENYRMGSTDVPIIEVKE